MSIESKCATDLVRKGLILEMENSARLPRDQPPEGPFRPKCNHAGLSAGFRAKREIIGESKAFSNKLHA